MEVELAVNIKVFDLICSQVLIIKVTHVLAVQYATPLAMKLPKIALLICPQLVATTLN
jgi:hypothetical protein